MKLLSFEFSGRTRVGALLSGEGAGTVVDLTALRPAWGDDMRAVLAWAIDNPEGLRALVQQGDRVPFDQVRLLAPVLAPGKIIGVAMNYHSFMEAARRSGLPLPPTPIWFTRPLSGLVGTGAAMIAPRTSAALDYEGELAIVIGKRCHGATAATARQFIGGYTIANDVTVRDWAARSPMLGKLFDTHAPLGPWIVTADEIAHPQALALRTWVNGELRQSSTTAEMILDCDALVAEVSTICTLEPGDIIITGTPDGCGLLFDPPRFLKPGDVVRIEIEGIGVLENSVIAQDAA